VTPGELLLEEFLKPTNLSQYRLAKEIGVPPQRIGEIIAGKRAITADTDLRLCRFFGLSNGYWLRAQAARYRGRGQGPCEDARQDQAMGQDGSLGISAAVYADRWAK
jgi:addiction module HigA family antidote